MNLARVLWVFIGSTLIYAAFPEIGFWRRIALLAAIVALAAAMLGTPTGDPGPSSRSWTP